MRRKDEKHRAFLRTLPCVICGDNTTIEACHIKMADARVAKRIASAALREDDRFTLPMCGAHHREQHSMSERRFWQGYGVDAVLTALAQEALETAENPARLGPLTACEKP